MHGWYSSLSNIWLGHLVIHVLFTTCCVSGPLVSHTALSSLALDLCSPLSVVCFRLQHGSVLLVLDQLRCYSRRVQMVIQRNPSCTGFITCSKLGELIDLVWCLRLFGCSCRSCCPHTSLVRTSSDLVLWSALHSTLTLCAPVSFRWLGCSPCAEGTSHVTEQESVSVDLLEHES